MKSFKAYIFILLYVIALGRPIAPLIDYALNYDYISQELCENKDLPALDCNGQCYLSKQFQENQDLSKTDSPALSIEWQDYPIGFIQEIEIESEIYFIKKQKLNSLEAQVPASPYIEAIPSPPWFV